MIIMVEATVRYAEDFACWHVKRSTQEHIVNSPCYSEYLAQRYPQGRLLENRARARNGIRLPRASFIPWKLSANLGHIRVAGPWGSE
jgi:hypothetical protein